MTLTAEGVETAEQRDWLRAEGCDHGQGYLFGRPAPAATVARMLATGGVPDRAMGSRSAAAS
jgi:EAL domain-containing protein (putative c-di-GMP-specific phosphodiesterase class I)